MNLRRIVVGFAIVVAATAHADENKPADNAPRIRSAAIKEASGLAVSTRDDRFLWALNDSGGTPDLHLIGIDGSDRGKVRVTNAKNTDWEDLASFTLDGKPWLLVADTGDNKGARKSVSIHVVPEPKLPSDGDKLDGTVAAGWHIDFTYQGGPRDCEAVAVDTAAEKIILISKRTKPPEVYELPLRAPKKKGVAVISPLGTTSVESPVPLPFHSQPVGLDITRDGSLAAVVTYYGVFFFPKKPGETWASAFSRPASSSSPHNLAQAESVAFSKDGKSVYVVSEGENSPIRKIPVPQP